jgi:hypothetical protein
VLADNVLYLQLTLLTNLTTCSKVGLFYYNTSGTLEKYIIIDENGIQLSTLPTSDPGIAGALFTSTVEGVSRVVRISAG